MEVHPTNVAVIVLCSWISWGCDSSILEGSGSSEVGTLEETSPACHCHMHFSRMEDHVLFLCVLMAHTTITKAPEVSVTLSSSHPGEGLISAETWTLTVFLLLLYGRIIPQVIWMKVMSEVLRKEWLLFGHCQNTDLW